MATTAATLPIVDLTSPDRLGSARSIRQACVEYGFFYLVNHGIEEELLDEVFEQSRKFFSLPLDGKMRLFRKEHRGYTPLYAEKLDPSISSKGDSKESFYIGPIDGDQDKTKLNQWPSQELLPSWRSTMEMYYEKAMSAGKRLISLIALALNLKEDYFEKIGALNFPNGFLRLLHYPGELAYSDNEVFGASAHSDYGMITLLVTDSVPGLQASLYSLIYFKRVFTHGSLVLSSVLTIENMFASYCALQPEQVCRDKFQEPCLWEDVLHMDGAFIVNIGDMMERWTNSLFKSTLHRVMPVGQERYSLAFFLDPNPDCIVECLESCRSESFPPSFPPIRSGDYLKERLELTYGS